MRRLAAAIAVLACLLAAPAALGNTIWVVKGRGFGHGVGLSQYGAFGFAQHGWNYRQILAHYYTGIGLGNAPKNTVRVLLETGKHEVDFSGAVQAGSRHLKPAKTYKATVSAGGVAISDTRGKVAAQFAPGPVQVSGSGGHVTLAGAGGYRGLLELRPSGSSLMVLNVVGLDDYVQGVVPREMIPSWPAEALKAQAVAARSYALATNAGGGVFDQYADTRSQVYGGMSAETPATNAAVQATADQVATYGGQVATTFFFSTSGGRTENVENVFYGSPPAAYLKSVPDPYDNTSPRHRWQIRLSQSQIQRKLGSLCSGRFRGIKVLKHGVSPRIVSANVVCSRRTRRVTGMGLRSALGLFDTWFRLTKVTTAPVGRHKSIAAVFEKGLVVRGISGTFAPAPRSGRVAVERRVHGHWRRVTLARVDAGGSFLVSLAQPGLYRVRAGGIAGDPVRVA